MPTSLAAHWDGGAGAGDASSKGPAKPEVLAEENFLGHCTPAETRTLKRNTSAMIMKERYGASDQKLCPNRISQRHPTKIH
jgi:hypothetical protein